MSTYPNRLNGYYTIEGKQYPSVTSILQAIAKPALYNWHFKQGAEAGRANIAKDMKELWSDFQVTGRKRMDGGSQVHDYLEAYFKKQTYMPPLIGSPFLKAVEMFLAKDGPHFTLLHSERQVHSNEHIYAGTLDAIMEYKDKIFVVDYKTSKDARIYDEAGLQLSAYQHAALEQKLVDHVDGRLVIAFGLDGIYKVKEMDDSFDTFLAAKELWKFLNNHA